MILTILGWVSYYCASILGTLCYASIAELLVHRHLMHHPYWIFGFKFEYPFRGHTLVHHQIFKGDETYEIGSHPPHLQAEHGKTIPMAWWNGPALVVTASLPFILWSLLQPSWRFVVMAAAVISLYYLTYEFIHYCMHDENKRHWFEPRWFYKLRKRFMTTHFYRWVDARHFLHHVDMRTNYNVVLPFADWFFGTLNKIEAWVLSKEEKANWPRLVGVA